jgi:hypothetical protein
LSLFTYSAGKATYLSWREEQQVGYTVNVTREVQEILVLGATGGVFYLSYTETDANGIPTQSVCDGSLVLHVYNVCVTTHAVWWRSGRANAVDHISLQSVDIRYTFV